MPSGPTYPGAAIALASQAGDRGFQFLVSRFRSKRLAKERASRLKYPIRSAFSKRADGYSFELHRAFFDRGGTGYDSCLKKAGPGDSCGSRPEDQERFCVGPAGSYCIPQLYLRKLAPACLSSKLANDELTEFAELVHDGCYCCQCSCLCAKDTFPKGDLYNSVRGSAAYFRVSKTSFRAGKHAEALSLFG